MNFLSRKAFAWFSQKHRASNESTLQHQQWITIDESRKRTSPLHSTQWIYWSWQIVEELSRVASLRLNECANSEYTTALRSLDTPDRCEPRVRPLRPRTSEFSASKRVIPIIFSATSLCEEEESIRRKRNRHYTIYTDRSAKRYTRNKYDVY